jgi:gamma-glutamyltranspeptidase/glutathione hydrolase/leukotriene-C4 hydrolase
MDDFSTPGQPNAFGLWPSPCTYSHLILVYTAMLMVALDNYPAPWKRSLSSMTPIIIEDADGQFRMALGGSGGSRIFGSVFQTILHSFRGIHISGSIEAGRVHDRKLDLRTCL